jgi:hypothetical protein
MGRIRSGPSASAAATARFVAATDSAEWLWIGTHKDFDKMF